MFKIGCHLSFSEGFLGMEKAASQIGATTYQFFTRNPRGGKAKPIDLEDVNAADAMAATNHTRPFIAHASYTLNFCAADDAILQFARTTLADDLQRMEATPGNLYNFHPGSHVGQGIEKGIEKIAGSINGALRPGLHTTVLLETMAGKGSEVGSRFEELKAIIDQVELDDMLGVCLDTCHVYDAGYDIVNDLDGVIAEFDSVIGLGRLKAIHLNDSMFGFQSHKDRHAKIGEGQLGVDVFAAIINHPNLKHLPFALETPCDLDGYAKEIALLKSLRNSE